MLRLFLKLQMNLKVKRLSNAISNALFALGWRKGYKLICHCETCECKAKQNEFSLVIQILLFSLPCG